MTKGNPLAPPRGEAKFVESAGQEEDTRHYSLGPPNGVVIEIAPEDVLTVEEVELLKRVRKGILPCPWCDLPLNGEFVYYELEGDDFYAGVRLSCGCGFVEY